MNENEKAKHDKLIKQKKQRRDSDEVYSERRKQAWRLVSFTKRDSGKVDPYIGLTAKQLKCYLNHNEFGFKWGDPNIEYDHIIPLSSAKTVEEVRKLSHYTNIQLLPSYYNRHIKGVMLNWDKEHLKNYLKENDK